MTDAGLKFKAFIGRLGAAVGSVKTGKMVGPELALARPQDFNQSDEKSVAVERFVKRIGGAACGHVKLFPVGSEESFEEFSPSDPGLGGSEMLHCWAILDVLKWWFVADPVLDCNDEGSLKIVWSAAGYTISSDRTW